jgi:hypothetical protein
MHKTRILVGTRKGAFILESGNRESWTVSEPLFGGLEVYHVKGSSLNPNRIYAAPGSGSLTSGTSSLRRPSRTRCTRAWKTPRCSGPRTRA